MSENKNLNLIVTCGTSQIKSDKLTKHTDVLANGEYFNFEVDLNELNYNDFTTKHQLTINKLKGRLEKRKEDLELLIGEKNNPFGAEICTIKKLFLSQPDLSSNLVRKKCFIISSDTVSGRVCADILKWECINFLKIPEDDINIKQVAGLREKPETEQGINEAMDQLVSSLKNESIQPQWRNIIIMTGGFKSILPCLTLTALYYGLEMAYLFEDSKHLQLLMPVIDWTDKKKREKWINNWREVLKEGKVAVNSWQYRLLAQESDKD